MKSTLRLNNLFVALALAATALQPAAWAADLPADVQTKVEKAKKRLVELASDTSVVAAVREANGHDAAGMTNSKWVDLGDSDPAVKAMLGSKVSTLIAKWEQSDETVNKLILRDQRGNLVAASVRPLIYNNASRPVFANPIKGQAWAAGEIKPDTSTQIPSVHVAAPVMDGGKAIGVLQSAVTAK